MPFSHYTIGGKQYARVTHILKLTESPKSRKKLNDWKNRIGSEESQGISQSARTRGTAMHSLCEAYLLGRTLPVVHESGYPFWESIQGAIARISNVKALEQRICHPELMYAGTYDCFADFDDTQNVIIDFKTSGKPKRCEWITDYFLQCAAYAGAIYASTGERVNGAAVLIALPDKQAQVFTLSKDELYYYWSLWTERLELFRQLDAA